MAIFVKEQSKDTSQTFGSCMKKMRAELSCVRQVQTMLFDQI